MSPFRFDLRRLALLAVAFTALIPRVAALDLTYCSVDNTASTNANSSIFQSNGLCYDFCDDNFAFAVVQDVNCWCSNYVPQATTSLSSCSEQCPGYPVEYCGGVGLFGYIALKISPLGTAGGSKTTSSKRVITTSSKYVTTSVRTSSSSSPTSTSTSSSKPVSHTTTSVQQSQQSSSSTSSPTSATWPTSVTPIVEVQTLTGQVRTVTYIPTSTPTSTSDPSTSGTLDQSSSQGQGHGLNTGQAVGLTIGLVALVAIIGALMFFCVRKRRRARDDEYDAPTPVTTSSGTKFSSNAPQVQMSQNTPFMLGTDGRQVVEGWEGEANTPGSRRSRLMPVDPRLDPFAPVYLRSNGSKSRDSVQTIQDNHDYSRRVHQKPVLRATNPD